MNNMTTHYNVEPMEVEAEAEDEVMCNVVRISFGGASSSVLVVLV